MSFMMFSTYSVFSLVGLVSSNRRLQIPLYFSATPKSMQMALACPMCMYPLGSESSLKVTEDILRLYIQDGLSKSTIIKKGGIK